MKKKLETTRMWLLIKTGWRNLFRQRRRTIITASAMAISLAMAIPTYGLVLGIRAEFMKGITGMDLGHAQLHDPAYPRGRALHSTLRHPERLLLQIRATPGVVAASARTHGFALLSHEVSMGMTLVPLSGDHPARRAEGVRFGRAIDPKAPWQKDVALACEAVISHADSRRHGVVVGNVLAPTATRQGGACERVRIVGLTHRAVRSGPDSGGKASLDLGLRPEDVQRAFASRRQTRAVSRDAAPVAIIGVDPSWERRVSFMADKVVSGRYLAAKPAREVVVGARLAKIMRLKVGTKVFLQAATLDASSGSNTDTLTVVGIFRTGVSTIDRSRIYLHITDSQRLMSLEGRAHEIAIIGRDPEKLGPVVDRIKKRVATLRLRVSTAPEGLRAGSRPLPAAVTVRDPAAGDTALLIPHDLRPRFDDLPGLSAIARRVYGKTNVHVAQALKLRIVLRGQQPDVFPKKPDAWWAALGGATAEQRRCAVAVSKPLATRLRLMAGAKLTPESAVTDGEPGCSTLRVAAILPVARADELVRRGPKPASVVSLSGLTAEQAEDKELPLGKVTLLRPTVRRPMRFVGVETALEPRLSQLDKRVVAGKYLPGGNADEGAWPVLLSSIAGRKLGIGVGTTLLLQTRDTDGKVAWRAARVHGTFKAWGTGLPWLVLPYFSAQQVDAPRLNARAHEMLLIPKKGTKAEDLAKAADGRLVPLVRTWDEIRPMMKDIAGMQNLFMGIMLFIIMTIAGMTVMNTMLMAVFERIREFGVLKSLGMRPRQVFGLIVTETLMLALLAAAVGGAVGVGLDHYLVVHGLDMSSITGGMSFQGTFINPIWKAVFTVQGVLVPMLMVSLVCLAVSLYPAFKAGRLKPVDAMRYHQ